MIPFPTTLFANAATFFATYNPADASPFLAFSNGNLTATHFGGGNVDALVRSTSSHNSKKYYFEMHVATTPNTEYAVGFANAAESLSNFLGKTLNSVGYYANSGTVFINNAVVATISTYAHTDIIGVAVDLVGLDLWYRVNNGNWNNSGTANPATGTGGISLASLNTGPYFAASDIGVVGAAQTMNFGASPFANAAPSGFISGWPR